MSVEIQMYRSPLCIMLIVGLLVVAACDSQGSNTITKVVEDEVEGRIYAQVLTPAGQRQGNEDFIPAPFNLCRSQTGNKEVILLRDALAIGSMVAIEPVGAMILDSAGVEKTVVVAVPSEPSLKTVNVQDLGDLLTEYESVRNMTQSWIVNHTGFGAFELIGWQDEQFARSVLSATQ